MHNKCEGNITQRRVIAVFKHLLNEDLPQPPLSCQFADDNEFPAAGSSLPMGSISTNVGRRRYRKWRRQIRRPPGEEKWCQSGIRHGGAEGCLKNCPRAPARRLPLISNDINLSSCVLPTHFFFLLRMGKRSKEMSWVWPREGRGRWFARQRSRKLVQSGCRKGCIEYNFFVPNSPQLFPLPTVMLSHCHCR